MVQVVNLHHYKDKKCPPGSIFIGRPSLFGNPFSHLPKTLAAYKVESRAAAVKSYAQWLATSEQAEAIREAIREMARRVAQGESLVLVCYCAPLSCHGDIIRHHILRIARDIMKEEAEVS